jgi:hypothetical protein
MKLQEGPAFGALIIGAGVAYLVQHKTDNLFLAAGVGFTVAIADYILVVWIQSFKKKK